VSVLHHPVDLEPSLVDESTYATRRRRVLLGVPTVLSAVVALLYVLPATLIVPNLTYAGRPALLLSLGLFCWWVVARIDPRLVMVGPQPLRYAAVVYLLSIMFSYVAGALRGLPEVESNALNFALLVTLQFLGVMLMAADGIPNWARLNGVLRVFVWSAAFMAVVGVVQSTLRFNLAQYMNLPGLEFKSAVADFEARGAGGLYRVAGTATHYIEFSTVLAVAVPFAIHYARFSATKRARKIYGTLALIIAAGVPIAISRTGIVALGAAVGVMFVLAWNWRTRYNILVIGVMAGAMLSVAKPGLIGTIRTLFTGADEDPSISGRTNDYATVVLFFQQRPWLGRGPGTLIPTTYLYLDNQWLLTLVTGGVVGVVAFAALHFSCIALGRIAMKRADREEDRHLCAAMISTLVVSLLVSATFDSLSFTTFSFTVALMGGFCGAVWRFTHPTRVIRTSHVRWRAN
jgi:O-antigen ligase